MSYMKKLISNRFFFYISWLLLSLVQAAGTELFDDEAYYWVALQYNEQGRASYSVSERISKSSSLDRKKNLGNAALFVSR